MQEVDGRSGWGGRRMQQPELGAARLLCLPSKPRSSQGAQEPGVTFGLKERHPMVVRATISALGFLSLREAFSLRRVGPPTPQPPASKAPREEPGSAAALCPVEAGRGRNRLSAQGVPAARAPQVFGHRRGAMPASSTIHVLQLLRELLAFVLLSYTVLLGALLLAGWTTYFLVLK
ncbi:unnamed protein product [Pipistrellus nathusii]|uniref:Uncharacterized protein n=1 Tax=Pipistrellus nathusii TaxID=59473 RepID=A0ABN9ZPI5_PIPNA